MSTRSQAIAFGSMIVALVVFGGLYVAWAAGRADDDIADRQARAEQTVADFEAEAAAQATPRPTPGPPIEPVELVPQPGEVVFVHRVPGDDYGRLGIRHANGTRTLLERRCLRVHVAAGRGLCLSQQGEGLTASYHADYYETVDIDEAFGLVDLGGYSIPSPSRARLSPSGRVAAVTGFVSGSSYADIGTDDDTETLVILDYIDNHAGQIGLVQFEFVEDGTSAGSGQYWGPTFADDDDFWVTGFLLDQPEILRGHLGDRTLAKTGWTGSCPSLSPDGETLVFKESQPDGSFRLAAVDLASGERWLLEENRSVDDQVEWLDDDTILYALHPNGDEPEAVQPEFDIWSLDIAPGSEPELFLPAANSPAVAR